MITDVDETLRRLLTAELGRIPGCPVYEAEQITFEPPTEADAAQDGEARVNLYLCDLRENLELRDESLPRVRGAMAEMRAGTRRAPVRMDLTYLVTIHAGHDPETEHRLLSDVLGVLLRFLAVPEPYLFGALEGKGPNSIPMMVGQPEHLEMMNPTGLWQALQGQMQPCLILVVTAPCDPFETKWTRLVRELAYGVGNAATPDVRPDGVADVRISAAGIVLDQRSEKPLPGVQVSVEGYGEAITGDDGMFSLLNLPPGQRTLRFRLHGYREDELPTIVPPLGRSDQMEPLVMALHSLSPKERETEAGRLAVSLRDGDWLGDGHAHRAPLTGTVLMADGNPAAYVVVRAGHRETSTDANGVYAFADLPPGDYTVVAVIPGQGETEVTKHRVR